MFMQSSGRTNLYLKMNTIIYDARRGSMAKMKRVSELHKV